MDLLHFEGEAEPTGTHQLVDGVYSARAYIPVEAPALALSNVAPTGPLGPIQKTGHKSLDGWLIAQSPLRDVPRDYFPVELDVSPLVARRDDDFACVIAHGHLQMDLAVETLDEGIALARFLVERAREVSGLDANWSETETAAPVEEIELDELDELKEQAEAAAAWVTLQLEREGNTLTGRPRLEGHGDTLDGELRLVWRDAEAAALSLSLRGALPGTGPRVALSPESTGLIGHLKRLGERSVGAPELDEPFVIRCEPGAVPTILALRAPLAELGAARARVDLFPDLVAVELDTPFEREQLGGILDTALRLWDACVRRQIEGAGGG